MLDDLKKLLCIKDDKQDDVLLLIISGTKKRLKALLGGVEPPDELSYIVLDVSVIRFNRIGSEGLASHTVEGESQSWDSDDFSGYKQDIQMWLDAQKEAKRGRVRFL
jgi:hypothetical protein